MAPKAPIGAAFMMMAMTPNMAWPTSSMITRSARPRSPSAEKREAEEQREQQNLQNVALGEGADRAVGNDVEKKIDAAALFRERRIFGDGGRVGFSGEASADLRKISNQQAKREGECGDDLEIEERLQADAADLARVLDMGDAGDDRAEDDRRDRHLDELDEAVAERLHPVLRGGVRRQPAEQRAQRNGREHLDIEVAVEGFAGGGGIGGHEGIGACRA